MAEMNFQKIEEKWQRRWEERKAFEAKEDPKKKNFYVLEMYPYPSASFLHMGHVRNYTIGDVYARFKRMQGFNVLYPMGYDSFGLPAEMAAKKEGIHPKKYADYAIKKIMEYQKALGNSYDWSRILYSHDPHYYRWNQLFFLKLFERSLAYRKKAAVNWCPNCESVLANEEAEGGKCWRCEGGVVQKELEQWFFRITAYADRLLKDLDKIEWPEKIKTMQRNWIGRSEGTEIYFRIEGTGKVASTFTTRPDTIFSVTFIALAPEHPWTIELTKGTKYEKEVLRFIEKAKKESVTDRINEEKEKEGVFLGKYAINPASGEKIPVYTANFAIYEYGTGIVMCDAHDKRDFRFARKYGIPLKFVISKDGKHVDANKAEEAYINDGMLFDSGKFSGMHNREALPKIAEWLEKNKKGKRTVNYSIHDWMISRQRYWGTPIPVIYCGGCGIVPVPEKDLPVLLPEKVDFKSSGNPLAANKEFVNTKCPECGKPAKRETDTMGGFVDSSWYFLRYCDNKNKEKPFDAKKTRYWMPVDQYIGGAEHAVMHLIYARFFVKALKDLGFVDFEEPFSKLFNQGIVYKDGHKMSKSFGNIVTQDEMAEKYGTDTARLFLMFVSSPDKQMEWSEEGIEGSFRIINKLVRLKEEISKKTDKMQEHKINVAIKKVTENIEAFEYPKAIIAIIEAIDYFSERGISKENYGTLLKLISPFCPHTAEELWEAVGNPTLISVEKWPEVDEEKIDEKMDKLETFVKQTLDDARNIIKMLGKPPKRVRIYIAPEWKYEAYNCILEHAKDPEKVIPVLMKNPMLRKYGNELVKFASRLKKEEMLKLGKIPEEKEEMEALNTAKQSFEKELGCRVEVIEALKSNSERARKAEPGKPGIEVFV